MKELSDWYVQYADQLERLRATNRYEIKSKKKKCILQTLPVKQLYPFRDARKTEDKTFVAAPFQPVEPGTEWER